MTNTISITDSLKAFRDAMLTAMGTAPTEILPDQITRWDDPNGKRGNKACYCQFFTDGCTAGYFGNWRTNHFQTWVHGGKHKLSADARTKLQSRIEAERARRKLATFKEHTQAAARAQVIYENSAPAINHTYLHAKGITGAKACAWARIYKEALILPLVCFGLQPWSLQFIRPDGSKRMMKKGAKQGLFIPVALTLSDTTLVCEGWATGVTLSQIEPKARVIAAVDAGNLEPVAQGARQRWGGDLVICGDDDRAAGVNVGRIKALEAAINTGAKVVFPDFAPDAPLELSDFNDLAQWAGVR